MSAAGGGSRRRSARSISTCTSFTRAFPRAASTLATSKSTARTGDQPSLAAAIASTPEPHPRSANGAARLQLEQQLEAHPSGGMAPGAERLAGVDDDLLDARRARCAVQGGRTREPIRRRAPARGTAPALEPVVRDLLGGDLDERAARGRLQRPGAPAARPARRRPRTRRVAADPTLLHPVGRELEQLRQDQLGVLARTRTASRITRRRAPLELARTTPSSERRFSSVSELGQLARAARAARRSAAAG